MSDSSSIVLIAEDALMLAVRLLASPEVGFGELIVVPVQARALLEDIDTRVTALGGAVNRRLLAAQAIVSGVVSLDSGPSEGRLIAAIGLGVAISEGRYLLNAGERERAKEGRAAAAKRLNASKSAWHELALVLLAAERRANPEMRPKQLHGRVAEAVSRSQRDLGWEAVSDEAVRKVASTKRELLALIEAEDDDAAKLPSEPLSEEEMVRFEALLNERGENI